MKTENLFREIPKEIEEKDRMYELQACDIYKSLTILEEEELKNLLSKFNESWEFRKGAK